jgi:hypothetical protein
VGSDIAVCIKIFDIFAAVVIVSEQKGQYLAGQFDDNVIRFIRLDPVLGTNRQCSFMEEMGRLSSHTDKSH